jgi:hypothetical protein
MSQLQGDASTATTQCYLTTRGPPPLPFPPHCCKHTKVKPLTSAVVASQPAALPLQASSYMWGSTSGQGVAPGAILGASPPPPAAAVRSVSLEAVPAVSGSAAAAVKGPPSASTAAAASVLSLAPAAAAAPAVDGCPPAVEALRASPGGGKQQRWQWQGCVLLDRHLCAQHPANSCTTRRHATRLARYTDPHGFCVTASTPGSQGCTCCILHQW